MDIKREVLNLTQTSKVTPVDYEKLCILCNTNATKKIKREIHSKTINKWKWHSKNMFK